MIDGWFNNILILYYLLIIYYELWLLLYGFFIGYFLKGIVHL
jgi:hypothetical protein